MTSALYYRLHSGGGGTNLQLISLGLAHDLWVRLQTQRDLDDHLQIERCAVIVNLLGLSLSQLLGQNTQHSRERVDQPDALLDRFLAAAGLDQGRAKSLSDRFAGFKKAYDATRHFGDTPTLTKYREVEGLTTDATAEHYSLTLEIWNEVITFHRTRPGAELSEFPSIEAVLKEQEHRWNWDPR